MKDQTDRNSIQPTGVSTDTLLTIIGIKEVELYTARQYIKDLQNQIKRLTGGNPLPPNEEK